MSGSQTKSGTRCLLLVFALACFAGCSPADSGGPASPDRGTGGRGGAAAPDATGGASGGATAQGGSGGSGSAGSPAGSGGGAAGSPSGGGESSGSGGAGGAMTPGGGSGGAGADASGPGDVGSEPGASDAGGGTGPAPSPAAGPSAACAGGAMMPGPSGNQTIQANGKSRTFILRLPTGYDGKRALPLMFLFHGAGGGASAFEGSAFGGIAKMAADKAVRIFPQSFGGNTWSRDEPDDVSFMDALMAWLEPKVCFDKGRVFATGHSSGAYFSHRLGCDRGGMYIRAVATNSGGQRKERTLDCKSPVAAWMSTGTGDNPGHVMGTRQARDVWAKLAGCTSMSMPTPPAPCVALTGCREGYPVHYCEHGGGHSPPGFVPGAIYNFLFGGKL